MNDVCKEQREREKKKSVERKKIGMHESYYCSMQ